MWTLIRNGGVIPMLFILVFGLLGLAASFYFAVRAERRSLGFIKSMMQAVLFATLAATAADLGATLYAASHAWEQPGDGQVLQAAHMIVEGFAESTSPGILGFSFLAVTAMLTAVGRRRLDERSEVR
ncbi:MAG: hypothetical protein JWO86_4231 [Myxococcaceae bacterium]|jgi:hypothetical protein|nr:hypothetical protein [Myxococcaceae bacterium]MEA2751300.1 hypothetical protein [Myxococcales bacterium]